MLAYEKLVGLMDFLFQWSWTMDGEEYEWETAEIWDAMLSGMGAWTEIANGFSWEWWQSLLWSWMWLAIKDRLFFFFKKMVYNGVSFALWTFQEDRSECGRGQRRSLAGERHKYVPLRISKGRKEDVF